MKKAWSRAGRILLLLSVALTLLFPVSAGAVDVGARVVLDSYEILEGRMVPGEYVTLRFYFQNISPDTSATGVLITYSNGNSSIVPVYGNSNQIYINTLAPGETVTKDVECQVLNYQSYTTAIMNFSLIYRDSVVYDGGNSFLIAIPLEDSSQVEIKNVVLPEQSRLQAQSTGHLSVENTGNKAIHGVILHCDGNIQETQKTLELGDLAAGASISIDLSLTFTQAGSQLLSLWVEYQDENGTTLQTEAAEYSVGVLEAEHVEQPQQTAGGVGGIVVMAGTVAVCAALALVAYRMLKKNDRYVE